MSAQVSTLQNESLKDRVTILEVKTRIQNFEISLNETVVSFNICCQEETETATIPQTTTFFETTKKIWYHDNKGR